MSIHKLHSFQGVQKKSSAVPFACICVHALPTQLTKTVQRLATSGNSDQLPHSVQFGSNALQDKAEASVDP